MTPGRLKRNRMAAWLGLVALVIQAFIPTLIAAEIGIAAEHSGRSVFTLCVFGHLHSASHRPADGSAPKSGGDEDGGTICPICVALQASPAFTAPAPVALPLPSGRPVNLVLVAPLRTLSTVATAAYRSRAPPLS